MLFAAACGKSEEEFPGKDETTTAKEIVAAESDEGNAALVSQTGSATNSPRQYADGGLTTNSRSCRNRTDNNIAPILLRNVTIIDGLGTSPMPMRDLLINHGCIEKIAVTSTIDPLPENTEILVGDGLTVMPGLIDAHTHIGRVGFSSGELMQADIDGMGQYLRATLYAGVTTILEAGSRNQEHSVFLRDEIRAGERTGPTIITVGATINALKTTQESVQQLTTSETRAEIKSTLDDLEKDGIEIVKLYAGLTQWEARHIMTSAKKRGIKGIADFWCSNLSRTGYEVTLIDAYAHGGCRKLTREEARWIADNDKFVMITFTAFDGMGGHRAFADYPDRGFLKNPLIVDVFGESILEEYYKNFQHIREQITEGEHSLYRSQLFGDVRHLVPDNYANVRLLFEEGAHIGMGTDAPFPPGSFPGEAMHFELEHHVSAGIPPINAIRFATYNNARFLGIAEQTGSIQQGKVADLLVVRGDPANSISDTRNIEFVIKGGILVDRNALKQQQ